MKQDLLFSNDSFIFSYRVGGLLIHNGKILLQKPKGDDYAVIGGHVGSMETTEDALKREYREELKAEIETERLLAIGEIFFNWGNMPCHQICLYYKIRLKDCNSIPMDGIFQGYDELGGRKIDLDFCWVPLKELEQGLKVYPTELIPYILDDSNDTAHFISRQI